MSKKYNLTFGTDPEMFLVEKGTRFLVPPVSLRRDFGLFVVEPDEKHPVFYKDSTISVMEDGALFEFTVTPSKTAKEMYEKVSFAKEILGQIAAGFNLEVLHSPIADFNVEKYFNNEELDEEQKMCVIAGCDPDEDALDSGYLSGVVRNLTEWNKRGAGGHLHIGTNEFTDLHKLIVPAVHLLATTVGVSATYLAKEEAAERERMQVFGRPGRYRPQVYGNGWIGVEYRTPSNSWLLEEEGAELIVRSAEKAIDLLSNPSAGKKHLEKYLSPSVDTILSVDKEEAEQILKEQDLL